MQQIDTLIAHTCPDVVQKYISSHIKTDVKALALKQNPFPDLPWQWVLQQISGKQKCAKKHPAISTHENIIYPTSLSIEQTSSEATAAYKSQLIKGDTLIDLTGGWGIDCYYFSKHLPHVTHCELDADLSAIVKHNFNTLGCNNITTIAGDSIAYLQQTNGSFGTIYLDPARRDQNKKKVFLLSDCTPDVTDIITLLKAKSQRIIIKASPLLDIKGTLQQLPDISEIHIVAVDNEVKELLFIIDTQIVASNTHIHTTNITKEGMVSYNHPIQEDAHTTYASELGKYLYLPNASIMKSGLFNSIANDFQLAKLHAHSHLYTSDSIAENFPGHIYEINESYVYQKSNYTILKGLKSNISIRNFPITVEELIKKHKLQNGGNTFTFFTTNAHQEKIVIHTKKIN
jgi:16S rRNA G966 N2-methylase RsmD